MRVRFSPDPQQTHIMADNNYCLDRITIYLLKQRVIDVEYLGSVARTCRTTARLYGHILAVLLDYMSPVDRDLIAKLATGQIDICDLDADEVDGLIAMGLLDDSGCWNPFVWVWASTHGFCATGCPEQWLPEYEVWMRYYLDNYYP